MSYFRIEHIVKKVAACSAFCIRPDDENVVHFPSRVECLMTSKKVMRNT